MKQSKDLGMNAARHEVLNLRVRLADKLYLVLSWVNVNVPGWYDASVDQKAVRTRARHDILKVLYRLPRIVQRWAVAHDGDLIWSNFVRF